MLKTDAQSAVDVEALTLWNSVVSIDGFEKPRPPAAGNVRTY